MSTGGFRISTHHDTSGFKNSDNESEYLNSNERTENDEYDQYAPTGSNYKLQKVN